MLSVLGVGVGAAALTVAWRSSGSTARDAPPVYHPQPLFTRAGGPIAPGPAPSGLDSTAPEECQLCHAEIVAEWRRSPHAAAWTDPVFQAEYRRVQQTFCRNCHAPLAADNSAAPVAKERRARGIDCAVCHIRDGHILGLSGAGHDEHTSAHDARLATSAFCGACHQFDFPARLSDGEIRYAPGQPLQDTLTEWSSSRAASAGQRCQDCHMPAIDSPDGTRHRSHVMAALTSSASMAHAVTVAISASRLPDQPGHIDVHVEIAGDDIGHAFPTGDMFRQAVLTVSAGAHTEHVTMQRHFANVITEDGLRHLRRQVADTRVPAPGTGTRRERLQMPAGDATQVTWSLELRRLPLAHAHARGLTDDQVRITMASGNVAITSHDASSASHQPAGPVGGPAAF